MSSHPKKTNGESVPLDFSPVPPNGKCFPGVRVTGLGIFKAKELAFDLPKTQALILGGGNPNEIANCADEEYKEVYRDKKTGRLPPPGDVEQNTRLIIKALMTTSY